MMEVAGLAFHHFGLAARDPLRAVHFLQSAGYRCAEPVYDPLQRVDLRWCTRDGAPSVEVVSAVDENGPLANVLRGRDSSFYHLCYELDRDTGAAVAAMVSAGLRVITVLAPTPAILFGGRNVSFHLIHGFGLVELLEPAEVPKTA